MFEFEEQGLDLLERLNPHQDFLFFSLGSHNVYEPDLIFPLEKLARRVFDRFPEREVVYILEQEVGTDFSKRLQSAFVQERSLTRAIARAQLEARKKGKQGISEEEIQERARQNKADNGGTWDYAQAEMIDRLARDYSQLSVIPTELPDHLVNSVLAQSNKAHDLIYQAIELGKMSKKREMKAAKMYREGSISFAGSLFVRDIYTARQLYDLLQAEGKRTVFVRLGLIHQLPYRILSSDLPDLAPNIIMHPDHPSEKVGLGVEGAYKMMLSRVPTLKEVSDRPEKLTIGRTISLGESVSLLRECIARPWNEL